MTGPNYIVRLSPGVGIARFSKLTFPVVVVDWPAAVNQWIADLPAGTIAPNALRVILEEEAGERPMAAAVAIRRPNASVDTIATLLQSLDGTIGVDVDAIIDHGATLPTLAEVSAEAVEQQKEDGSLCVTFLGASTCRLIPTVLVVAIIAGLFYLRGKKQ